MSAKATHIVSAKNIRILYIESAKTVNEMTLNELVKLTMLWTTGPRILWKPETSLTPKNLTIHQVWIFTNVSVITDYNGWFCDRSPWIMECMHQTLMGMRKGSHLWKQQCKSRAENLIRWWLSQIFPLFPGARNFQINMFLNCARKHNIKVSQQGASKEFLQHVLVEK